MAKSIAEDIREAILAAAENKEAFCGVPNGAEENCTEGKAKEGGNGPADSFLRRLHQNSQLLSSGKTNIGPVVGVIHGDLFSPSSKPLVNHFVANGGLGGVGGRRVDNLLIKSDEREGSSEKQHFNGVANGQRNGENVANGDDKSSTRQGDFVNVELPSSVVGQLKELFGDGGVQLDLDARKRQSVPPPVEVALPIWVCELLYRAVQKIPLPDLPHEQVFNNIITDDAKKQKRSEGQNNISLINRLYEIFPNISQKTIRQIAREKDYDYERIADYLINVSEQSEWNISNEGSEGEEVRQSVIVHSRCPRAIGEQHQRSNSPPVNPTPVTWSYKNNQIEEIKEVIARMDQERSYYIEMGRMNVGMKNAALCSHYMRRAHELAKERDCLQQYCDRFRAWNSQNEDWVDLHEMGVDRAIQHVKYKVDLCRQKYPHLRKLHVITGHGKTTGQPSVIKAKLVQLLRQKGIDHCVSAINKGVIEVRLGGICERLSD